MKVVFTDRDGTLIVDPPDERVDNESKIQLFPDTIEALKYLASNNYAIIIITNQISIAEGRISQQDFKRIDNKVLQMIEPSDIKVLNVYFCPHHPDDNCECRKPKPKMILDAAKEFNVDLTSSYMIGDRETDIQAGLNAGTKTIHVLTGLNKTPSPNASYTANSLLEAARLIVNG